jgi:DNA-binding ferritin-like protein
MRLIDILALFKAIKNTAKKYHWKTTGSTFMSDHLLFDRIYDDIDDDQVDTIVEQYYMGVGRKDINDLDNLITLSAQYEGKSFSATSESIILMYQELARMMNTFLINIEKLNLLRGINSELDNLSSTITQLYGLVTARLCQ